MVRYIISVIHKKPLSIILHVVTEVVKNSLSREILDSILKLKAFVTENLPNSIMSTPTLREQIIVNCREW